jgi:hypothetical protein
MLSLIFDIGFCIKKGFLQPIGWKLFRIKTKMKQNNLNNFEINFEKFLPGRHRSYKRQP